VFLACGRYARQIGGNGLGYRLIGHLLYAALWLL
jgi:hypothetical protein